MKTDKRHHTLKKYSLNKLNKLAANGKLIAINKERGDRYTVDTIRYLTDGEKDGPYLEEVSNGLFVFVEEIPECEYFERFDFFVLEKIKV